MLATAERRMAARLTIPWQFRSKPSWEVRQVVLLDLSATGARIEQPKYLREGAPCYVELPPALGDAHLAARVIWTRPQESSHTAEGGTPSAYQSGLAFVGLTSENRMVLSAALAILAGQP